MGLRIVAASVEVSSHFFAIHVLDELGEDSSFHSRKPKVEFCVVDGMGLRQGPEGDEGCIVRDWRSQVQAVWTLIIRTDEDLDELQFSNAAEAETQVSERDLARMRRATTYHSVDDILDMLFSLES